MKVLFLDESGDHSLSVVDPQYPVFVLGGIIVDQAYAEGEMDERVRRFKLELFGRDDLILNTADIARNRNGFERMIEPEFRERFYGELNRLMRELDYTVVACVIRKDAHLARYGEAALDPYMLSLGVLVERFCFEVGNVAEGGLIVAERRGPTLDRQLELAWLSLTTQGTRYLQARTIKRRIVGMRASHKRENVSGLQLADLVVSPVGRYVLGKAAHEDFRIVEAKLRRRGASGYGGTGLVVLPKA